MDHRKIELQIDNSSWGGPVPPNLAKLSKRKRVALSIDVALLLSALLTRPPDISGFSLADCWAWMRYRPALIENSQLRLRQEWQDIDPHQKTILSDELAMGVMAALLIRKLDFHSFANTIHFVKTFASGSYFLKGTSKSGQKKSPDFVALDSSGNLSVFECKGTQQNRRTIKSSTASGVDQKKNFGARAGSVIDYSLVLGLFIPQFDNREKALIHIKDPNHANLSTFLHTISAQQREIGIVQIDLAKHFALMGLTSIAHALAHRIVDSDRTLGQVNDERDQVLSRTQDQLVTTKLHSLPPGAFILDGREIRGIVFSMSCPTDFYRRLIGSNDISREISKFAHAAKGNSWKASKIERGTQLQTPLGFRMSLEYLTQPNYADQLEGVRSLIRGS